MIVKFISVVLRGSKDNTYKFAVPTCRTIIEQKDRKETNHRKEKLKGAPFFCFRFCKVINTWGRIKVVRLTLRRTVFVFHSCSPRPSQTTTCVLCFLGKKEKERQRKKRKRRKQKSKPSTTTTTTFCCLENFWQDDSRLSFHAKDQQRKIIRNTKHKWAFL